MILSRGSITGKSIHGGSLTHILFPLMDMPGVMMPHKILAQNIHPCLSQRQYSKVYSMIRQWSALDMKLDMAGIFCRCDLVLALG